MSYLSQLQIGHGLLVALHAPLKSLRLLLAVLIPQHSPHGEVLRSDFLLSDRVWHRIQETLDSNSVVLRLMSFAHVTRIRDERWLDVRAPRIRILPLTPSFVCSHGSWSLRHTG